MENKKLRFQIQCIEENIALKKKLGKDTKFEKEILKSFRAYLKDHPAGQEKSPMPPVSNSRAL